MSSEGRNRKPVRRAQMALRKKGPMNNPATTPKASDVMPKCRAATTPDRIMQTLYRSGTVDGTRNRRRESSTAANTPPK